MTEKLVLIDLSSIARPIYEVNATTDPTRTGHEIVARIRALASAHPHTAICCDSGKSFRKELEPSYKANREQVPQVYYHQLAEAIDVLRNDGFPIWAAQGFEADDVIASAARRRLSETFMVPVDILIVSADKDLRQLVGPRVEVFAPGVGKNESKTYDGAAVKEKYGIEPHQMNDYLALVGDSSDNVKGADGIGPKKAAALLQTFGNIEDVLAELDADPTKFQPATVKSLTEFRERLPLVRQLLTLRTDAPVPFEEILRPRTPLDVVSFGPEDDIEASMPTLQQEDSDAEQLPRHEQPSASSPVMGIQGQVGAGERDAVSDCASGPRPAGGHSRITGDSNRQGMEHVGPTRATGHAPAQTRNEQQAIALRALEVVAPAEWERQLEPRSMEQAKELATSMFASRLFSAYGHPAGIMATVLAGRELGIAAMGSLRAFHIIDGKPTMSAGVIHALVLNSGKAEYFRCSERTAERATFVTKRKGDPEVSLTFTIDEARQAWTKEKSKFDTSGWGKNPADMCVARASSKLARLVYPDVVHGLYASEEFDQ